MPPRLQYRDLVPTGKLAFEFVCRVSHLGLRKLWTEAEGKPFERMLPEIISSIHTAIRCAVDDAEKNSAGREAYEREARRRREEMQQARMDESRWHAFLRIADAHGELGHARRLVAALDGGLTDRTTLFGDRTASEWLEWLRTRLAKADGLKLEQVLDAISQAFPDGRSTQ